MQNATLIRSDLAGATVSGTDEYMRRTMAKSGMSPGQIEARFEQRATARTRAVYDFSEDEIFAEMRQLGYGPTKARELAQHARDAAEDIRRERAGTRRAVENRAGFGARASTDVEQEQRRRQVVALQEAIAAEEVG